MPKIHLTITSHPMGYAQTGPIDSSERVDAIVALWKTHLKEHLTLLAKAHTTYEYTLTGIPIIRLKSEGSEQVINGESLPKEAQQLLLKIIGTPPEPPPPPARISKPKTPPAVQEPVQDETSEELSDTESEEEHRPRAPQKRAAPPPRASRMSQEPFDSDEDDDYDESFDYEPRPFRRAHFARRREPMEEEHRPRAAHFPFPSRMNEEEFYSDEDDDYEEYDDFPEYVLPNSPRRESQEEKFFPLYESDEDISSEDEEEFETPRNSGGERFARVSDIEIEDTTPQPSPTPSPRGAARPRPDVPRLALPPPRTPDVEISNDVDEDEEKRAEPLSPEAPLEEFLTPHSSDSED